MLELTDCSEMLAHIYKTIGYPISKEVTFSM
jgi:hypothetical protein